MFFYPICTRKVLDALFYLKNNSTFYSNIQTKMENSPPELRDRGEDEEIRIKLANESDVERQG